MRWIGRGGGRGRGRGRRGKDGEGGNIDWDECFKEVRNKIKWERKKEREKRMKNE